MKLRYCEKCGELLSETEVHECPPIWEVWYQDHKSMHLRNDDPMTAQNPIIIHASDQLEAARIAVRWDDQHNEFWLSNDHEGEPINVIVRGQGDVINVVQVVVHCPFPVYETTHVAKWGKETGWVAL